MGMHRKVPNDQSETLRDPQMNSEAQKSLVYLSLYPLYVTIRSYSQHSGLGIKHCL